MTNLTVTQANWLEDFENGSNNYRIIDRIDDEWYYFDNHDAYPILSLSIAIDEGWGMRPEYDYSVDSLERAPLATAIVIDLSQSKMILEDMHGYYGFGFFDVPAPAEGMRIQFETAEWNGLILAHRNFIATSITPAFT